MAGMVDWIVVVGLAVLGLGAALLGPMMGLDPQITGTFSATLKSAPIDASNGKNPRALCRGGSRASSDR